jgi:hypothetical protein
VSEAEILEQMFSIWDRYWVLAQWWTSVSFGLILVAFFAASRLSLMLLLVVIALYSGYSAWVYFLFDYNLEVAYALGADLLALESDGQVLSRGSKALLESNSYRYGEWIANLIVPATFFACVVYLVYSYTQERVIRA